MNQDLLPRYRVTVWDKGWDYETGVGREHFTNRAEALSYARLSAGNPNNEAVLLRDRSTKAVLFKHDTSPEHALV